MRRTTRGTRKGIAVRTWPRSKRASGASLFCFRHFTARTEPNPRVGDYASIWIRERSAFIPVYAVRLRVAIRVSGFRVTFGGLGGAMLRLFRRALRPWPCSRQGDERQDCVERLAGFDSDC